MEPLSKCSVQSSRSSERTIGSQKARADAGEGKHLYWISGKVKTDSVRLMLQELRNKQHNKNNNNLFTTETLIPLDKEKEMSVRSEAEEEEVVNIEVLTPEDQDHLQGDEHHLTDLLKDETSIHTYQAEEIGTIKEVDLPHAHQADLHKVHGLRQEENEDKRLLCLSHNHLQLERITKLGLEHLREEN